MVEYLDLNEFVESIGFTVKEIKYELPPMNDAGMNQIMELGAESQKLSQQVTSLQKSMEDGEVRSDDEMKLDSKLQSDLATIQNTMLNKSVRRVKEDGNLEIIPNDEFTKWPIRLKAKVLTMVYSQMGSETTDEETEKN